MADRVGQGLGNYKLIRLIGRGGFGEVYLGEHIYLKTEAAIKLMDTLLTTENREDFLTEARTLASLEHPHIVRILEFGVTDSIPYLVMSYAPNGTLRQRYPQGTRLPLSAVVSYVKQVADALQYAHDQKLIHRDVKPENMLLGRRDEILLSDFGIAAAAHTEQSMTGQNMAGTVSYMAPEQLEGRPRPASDQYALGIVVYEWLCGERPFQGSFVETAVKHLSVSPPTLRQKVPDISSAIEEVVLRALAKDPEKRFASVQEFADVLEEVYQRELSDLPVIDAPLSLPPALPLTAIPFISSTPTQENPPEKHESTMKGLSSDVPPVPPESLKSEVASPGDRCPFCGDDEIRPGDDFCPNCGKRLPAAVSQLDEEQLPTIGTRFMPTVQAAGNTGYAAPGIAPPDQAPVADLWAQPNEYTVAPPPDQPLIADPWGEPYDPTVTAVPLSPYSTSTLEQTIAQLLDEGDRHYNARSYEKALKAYERVLQLDPRNVRAHGNKGNVLGKRGLYEEALAAYNTALSIDNRHVSIWNARGDVLAKLRRYEQALVAYETALNLSPKDPLTWAAKGNVFATLRRYTEAADAYSQCLSLAPQNALIWAARGNVLTRLKNYKEALIAYKAALAINSNDGPTWAVKGDALAKLKRYEEALVAYTRAAEIFPKRVSYWIAVGEMFSELQRYEEALDAYKRANILNPGDIAITRKCAMLRDLLRHKEESTGRQGQGESTGPSTSFPNQQATHGGAAESPTAPANQQATHGTSEQEADTTRVFDYYDVFLSYAVSDVDWIETNIAMRLEDEHNLRVWLDRWMLIPGQPWREEMKRAIEQTRCYAICVGEYTSTEWFQQEVERALERREKDPSFRVLVVLLPNAKEINIDNFPKLDSWIDFRRKDPADAFYLLVCGVQGIRPGRRSGDETITTTSTTQATIDARAKLTELLGFKKDELIDESIAVEFQRLVLKQFWLGIDDSKGDAHG